MHGQPRLCGMATNIGLGPWLKRSALRLICSVRDFSPTVADMRDEADSGIPSGYRGDAKNRIHMARLHDGR